ncbi:MULTISPECIES: hypothetical protein [Marinobacter]|uniref:hypothetical protein n=1 Tax=Marinobacter TaxID=2742 RepID=UPI002942BC41|nr:hypothetical protein [Marinobacter salarius]WOI18524.1 hypothetical protein R1T46_17390 [Marinobacter salarius]
MGLFDGRAWRDAVFVGTAFTGLQQGLWAVLGSLYVLVGLLYLGGGTSWFIALA